MAPPIPAAALAAAPVFPPVPPWGVVGANPPPVPQPVFLPPLDPAGVLVAPPCSHDARRCSGRGAGGRAAAPAAPAGLAAAGGAVAPAPAASGAALPFGGFNGLLEMVGGLLGPGGRARAVAPERMITDGARTCAVKFDDVGKRIREYREAVNMMHGDPWADWPLAGLRVFLWGARFMLENGGTPTGWHSKWRADGKLQSSDPGVIVHEEFCRMIQPQLCYVRPDELGQLGLLRADDAPAHADRGEVQGQVRIGQQPRAVRGGPPLRRAHAEGEHLRVAIPLGAGG